MTSSARLGQGALCVAVAVLPVVWALDLPQIAGILLYPEQVAGLLFGLAAASVFLTSLTRRKGPVLRALDAALIAAALWVGLHVHLRFPVLSEGAFFHPGESLVLGIGMAVVGLEALRRVSGWSLIVILALLVLYASLGPVHPRHLKRVGWSYVGADTLALIGWAVGVG